MQFSYLEDRWLPAQFKYGEVEAALSALADVSTEKRIAFRARLKHLQRLGFPSGINTGSGKKADYDVATLTMMAVATAMMDIGLAPERIVKLGTEWSWVSNALRYAVTNSERVFLVIYPIALAPLRSDPGAYESPLPLTATELARRLAAPGGDDRPFAVIDLTRLIGRLKEVLPANLDIRGEIAAWRVDDDASDTQA